MTIILPWPPSALSPNHRGHWAQLAKAKKAYRTECAWQAKAQGARRIEADRIHVAFTFYPPNRQRRDLDGCISRMKSGIDGLADVLGVDDSRWSMEFRLVDEVRGLVKVEVSA